MLEFDAENHIYRLDGVQIPSVSEVLRFASRELYGSTSKQALDLAADRGTRVHAATEALDRTGTADVDQDIQPYVLAYAQFLRQNSVKWDMIEAQIIGKNRDYAGTLDRLGLVNGEQVLMDIKTTRTITARHKKLYAAQLTAYYDATWTDGWLINSYVEKFLILQLKNNGGYELMVVDPEEELWNACLLLHKTFTARKRGRQ